MTDIQPLTNKKQRPVLMAVLVAIPVLCVATLLVWSASDASFPMARASSADLVIACIENLWSIGSFSVSTEMSESLHWNRLGSRVTAIFALYGAGSISTLGLIILTARHFTERRALLSFAVLATWIVLPVTQDAVDHWRMTRQIAAILPQFELAANELTKHWPEAPGEIPPGIRFYVNPDQRPDILVVYGYPIYPTHETFGMAIERGRKGIIRFDLAAAFDCGLEYHPQGTEPAVYVSKWGFTSPPVFSVQRVGEDWFLVRYR